MNSSWLAAVDDLRTDRFRTLYVSAYGRVFNFAQRRTDVETARDVTAETFLIAWRRLDVVPIESPMPWLYRTAGLTLANENRRDRRQTGYVLRAQADIRRDAGATVDVAEEVAESDRIRLALLALAPADAEILRLTSWEDLDLREVSLVLDCTVTAARVRLHRARRRLAVVLDDEVAPVAAIRLSREMTR